ncbi:uncharacterized protein PFL1_05371 [Pseudozyma flocculosa PF-1]|uniref:Ribosome biogenesis protein NOP53 n=2 Tax=Pseudozyma flocculosa TaxID=84751 RepID=A0A5C3FCF9_9BASI|nr:uncharacterized protein PFL1_05371 [Pseudozyma flocculosa PF-1]EPQ27087.1 hypothetical protein PFL1_05371 [Pseudozyma flocculosa PF-1]SPO41345.1 related to Glioma tumor suppressor candidate region gene 2 protein [Pseudozyma flocculosa]
MAPTRTAKAQKAAANTAATDTDATSSKLTTASQPAVVGKPAQHAQSSRKGKAAWRKNIDLTSTEAHLAQMRDEENMPVYSTADGSAPSTGGKPLHAVQDDALFVEDRAGQETTLARRARQKKPLKSLEILSRTTGAAPVQAKARAQFKLLEGTAEGKAKSQGISKKMKDKLRRMAGRADQITGEDGPGARDQSDAVKLAMKEIHDVWAAGQPSAKGKGKQASDAAAQDGAAAAGATENDWIPVKKVKMPKSFLEDEMGSVARSLPSVSLPHPGTSYNPDLDSHDRLIQEAYEIERKLEEAEQADDEAARDWARRMREAAQREAILERVEGEKRYKGMEVDLPGEDDDDGDEASGDEDDAEGAQAKAKPARPQRKTKQQRAKAQKAAEQAALAQARKQARREKGVISELPKLRKQHEAAARARAAAAEERRLAKEQRLRTKGVEGLKLGKYKVPTEKIDVQVGEELSENLRTLRPEGSLLRDRYTMMQKRALIEPRRKVRPTKPKTAKKLVETHAYKRFV